MFYLKSKWQRGPREDLPGPVLVSATRFIFRRHIPAFASLRMHRQLFGW